jgi:hypothetical protein
MMVLLAMVMYGLAESTATPALHMDANHGMVLT